MSVRLTILLCALSALGGAIAYQRLSEPVVVTKVETVEKVVNRDVVKHTTVTKRPDGTVVKESTTTDKSKSEQTAQTISAPSKPNWLVGAFYDVKAQTYSGVVLRRVAGPVSVGVQVSKDSVGVGVLIEF